MGDEYMQLLTWCDIDVVTVVSAGDMHRDRCTGLMRHSLALLMSPMSRLADQDATTCYSSGDNIYFTFSCLSSASAPVSSSSTGASIESSTGSSIEESSTGAYSSTGVASLDTTMVYQYYNDSACTALNPLSYTFVSSINAGCGALSSDQSAQYICQNTTGTEFSFTVRTHGTCPPQTSRARLLHAHMGDVQASTCR